MAAIAAAEVAKLAKIGVISLVKTNQSNVLGSLGTTIVAPGIKFECLDDKILLLIGVDAPFGDIT